MQCCASCLPSAVFPALPVLGGSSPVGSIRYSLVKWSLGKVCLCFEIRGV